MTRAARHIALLALLLLSLAAAAQDTTATRRVTPVRPSTNVTLRPGKDVSAEVVEQYITGDSIKLLEEQRRDSLRRTYTRYPRLTDLAIGLNFIDPLLMAFGQKYASVDVNATLNMWNRLQPTLAIGIGWARNRPDDMNFTYRAKPSPYLKIGANYNFLFKSKPDYQVTLGLRLGYSTFGYEITDITHTNSYWRESLTYSITGQRSHALWGEVTAGLKVRITGPFSLGWNITWHHMFTCPLTGNSRPWYIPGYGTRDSALAFAMTACYTLKL